jgi:hypothetical protein
MTPITPLESGVENIGMFERGKAQSLFVPARTSLERPVSAYTDIEDDDSSDFEEYSLGSTVSSMITWSIAILT